MPAGRFPRIQPYLPLHNKSFFGHRYTFRRQESPELSLSLYETTRSLSTLTVYSIDKVTFPGFSEGTKTVHLEYLVMTLPLDLILVRHGQSEGNAAKRLSEAGDHSAYSTEFRNRHSGTYRLTDLGRKQATLAGTYINREFCHYVGYGFDRYYTSEYVRAKETAGLLGLPEAKWFSDVYLTERDWGDIDIATEQERAEKFGQALRMRQAEPFFWQPPNGESFLTLCLRIDRVLDTLHRECSDKRVIIVCHGEVMRAFQVRLERLSQRRFRELVLSNDPSDRIHNCEVIHYTRRDPGVSRKLQPYIGWVKKIRPAEEPFWHSGWQPIRRPTHSDNDLLAEVGNHPLFLK